MKQPSPFTRNQRRLGGLFRNGGASQVIFPGNKAGCLKTLPALGGANAAQFLQFLWNVKHRVTLTVSSLPKKGVKNIIN